MCPLYGHVIVAIFVSKNSFSGKLIYFLFSNLIGAKSSSLTFFLGGRDVELLYKLHHLVVYQSAPAGHILFNLT